MFYRRIQFNAVLFLNDLSNNLKQIYSFIALVPGDQN